MEEKRPLDEVQHKLRDMDYENRYNRLYARYLLVFVPLLLYVGVSYWEFGYVSWLAVGVSALASTLVVVFLHRQVKSRTLEAMRREGVSDESYQPPSGF